jgi:uncharacterized protein YndB with AHSA1/START domain
MTTVDEGILELETRMAASPETVFPLISSAEGMARWFGSTVELDAKPGGVIRVDINGRDIAKGEIVEIEPPVRVVFTFGWEGETHPVPVGSSRVEITLKADGDSTVVTLRHTGLTEEQAASHREGWEHYMPRLLEASEGRDPGKDPWSEPQEEMEQGR